MRIYSDHQIFEDVEKRRGTEAAERFGDCVSDIPEYPVEGIINRLNQELEELQMPYLIDDLVRMEEDQFVWTIVDNVHPKLLDMEEFVYNDDRGNAVYQLLIQPYRELDLIFPSTLEGAVDLFKINLKKHWTLHFFAVWLHAINKALQPLRAEQAKECVEKLTYRNPHEYL